MQYGLSGKTHLYRHFCHDELQISSPLFFAFKIHLVTPYPAISTVKIFIKMKLFTQRYISSRNDPNITHTKSGI